jgi:hypothetical protein
MELSASKTRANKAEEKSQRKGFLERWAERRILWLCWQGPNSLTANDEIRNQNAYRAPFVRHDR